MRKLIAQWILKDGSGNKKRLTARMGDDGSLYYSMKGYTSETGFALSNMQLKKPMPEFREDTLQGTLQAIESALASGLYQQLSRQVFATVDKSPCCPHCGGELS